MMTERLRSANTAGYNPKMDQELLSPRKSILVVVIVVGCFAVLWPNVFYPMLVGSATRHMKPSPIDKATGCCDVISETDVNTIKIMSELCSTIVSSEDEKLSGKELIQKCRNEVLEICGIDISAVLQEQVRLGQSVKEILDQVRSLNGSLCLKYNFGVAPWRLGVPHRVTVKVPSSNIRQERPHHLRSELVHPAFKERGRAIPQPQAQAASPSKPPPRVVEGRPGPIPGMRPTIGGAGHVVPPPKQSTGSMGVIMPIYTAAIVVFFVYTLLKVLFKKQPEGVGGALYPPIDPDPHFRKEVFESERSRLGPRITRDSVTNKLVVNAMSALLDEVDREIEARRKTSEVASEQQDLVNGTLSNGDALKPQDEEQPTVKVLGMEMTASCEGGKKWSRPESPVLPTSPPPPAEPAPPPQEIFLEGALPAQSHLLVADSATEPEPNGEDPAVVLAGKMTLSVVSLDSSENGADEHVEEISQEDNNEEIMQKISDEVDNLIRSGEPLEKHVDRLIDSLAKTEEFLIVEQNVLSAEELGTLPEVTEEIPRSQTEISETLPESVGDRISSNVEIAKAFTEFIEEDLEDTVPADISEGHVLSEESFQGQEIVEEPEPLTEQTSSFPVEAVESSEILEEGRLKEISGEHSSPEEVSIELSEPTPVKNIEESTVSTEISEEKLLIEISEQTPPQKVDEVLEQLAEHSKQFPVESIEKSRVPTDTLEERPLTEISEERTSKEVVEDEKAANANVQELEENEISVELPTALELSPKEIIEDQNSVASGIQESRSVAEKKANVIELHESAEITEEVVQLNLEESKPATEIIEEVTEVLEIIEDRIPKEIVEQETLKAEQKSLQAPTNISETVPEEVPKPDQEISNLTGISAKGKIEDLTQNSASLEKIKNEIDALIREESRVESSIQNEINNVSKSLENLAESLPKFKAEIEGVDQKNIVVEEVEKEVDGLIQEAIENVQEQKPEPADQEVGSSIENQVLKEIERLIADDEEANKEEIPKISDKIETTEFVSDEDELGSDEEVVDEIEEITYTSSEEEASEEGPSDDLGEHHRINGNDSKYATEDLTDGEDEEIEVEEIEEPDYLAENNHVDSEH